MLAEEWFADFIRRVSNGSKKARLMLEAVPHHADQKLAAEREYDAESRDLLKRIHNGSRQPIPGVTVPVEVRRVG